MADWSIPNAVRTKRAEIGAMAAGSMFRAGMKRQAIADRLGRPVRTVSRWVKAACDGEG